MMTRRMLVLGAAVGLAIGPASSWAQAANDHLECYKVRDAARLAAVVDLATPQFGGASGCRVSTKSVELCVPASKQVDEATVDGNPITPTPTDGPPAARSYLCYKLQCPKEQQPAFAQAVRDQFGARTVGSVRTSRLCTPATLEATNCGAVVCPVGTVCCNPLLSICIAPGQACVL
jgi:hypothetical protein